MEFIIDGLGTTKKLTADEMKDKESMAKAMANYVRDNAPNIVDVNKKAKEDKGEKQMELNKRFFTIVGVLLFGAYGLMGLVTLL